MNFLKSIWGLALVGAVLYIVSTAGFLYFRKDAFLAKKELIIPTSGTSYLWNFESAEVDKLITEIKTQRKALDAKESDLAKLSGQLASEREELQKVRADVEAMRGSVKRGNR